MLWSPLDIGRQAVTGGPALDPLVCHANTATVAYYHHSTALPLESLQPLVYKALSRVILQLSGMEPVFQYNVQFIQLRDGRNDEVDRLVEEQQNLKFAQPHDKLPCWRLIIAYTAGRSSVSDIVACCVVGEPARDQLCAMDFHRSFLAALLLVNKAELSKSPSEYPTAKYSKRLRGFSTSQQGKQPSHSRFKTVILGTTDTAKLLIDCSASKTDLTCVMQAIIAASLFANLPLEFTTLCTAGQISHSGTIGNSIRMPCSRYITTHNRAQGWHMNSIWSEARRIHTAFKAELGGKVKSNSLRGFLRREGGYLLCNTKETRETSGVSVAVSSIGRFQNSKSSVSERQQEWQLGRMMSSNDNHETGAALSITLVVGGDECLTIGFSWLEGDIEDVWLDRVIDTMRRLIEELLHTSGATKIEIVPWGGSVSRLVCVLRDLTLE